MIVSVPLVLLSSSWLPVRVIVCGVAKTVGSKVIVSAPVSDVGQVDRLRGGSSVPGGRADAVGGRVDDQRDGLGLEGADVDGLGESMRA